MLAVFPGYCLASQPFPSVIATNVQLLNFNLKKCTFQDRFRGLKTAPEDSLTFFLAVCICIVYHSYGGEYASLKFNKTYELLF